MVCLLGRLSRAHVLWQTISSLSPLLNAVSSFRDLSGSQVLPGPWPLSTPTLLEAALQINQLGKSWFRVFRLRECPNLGGAECWLQPQPAGAVSLILSFKRTAPRRPG